MDSIVSVMKKVAGKEVQKIYTTELGIVTSVFPHASESDKDNYECSIQLKNKKQPDGSDFELRKVPLLTQHLGLVNIPKVGDLVLVTFVGGNLNAPIIIGRLYNDEDRPPINQEQEFLLQHNLEEGGSFKIDAEGVITLTSKNEQNVITVKDEEITTATDKASITVKGGDVTLKNEQCQVVLSGSNITIDNGSWKITVEGGGITLDAGSSNVTVKVMGSIKIGDANNGFCRCRGKEPQPMPLLITMTSSYQCTPMWAI
ncbi:MAG UNVERIFIED_CONTAM: phage baseplate assembly protein V [Microcystis novacekii LVE1205-3]|jgi:phage baseplate assembly protein V